MRMLMSFKHCLAFVVVAAVFASAFSAYAADPVVESVTTTVAGPINGRTVSVTFTFSDADGDACHIALFGHDTATLTYYPMVHFAEGDIYDQTFAPGTHTVIWQTSQDREPGAPALSSSNFKVYVQVSDSGRIAPGRYLVIDVSGGTAATSYPFEYKDYVDVSLAAYKTDKIVLRELPDGSFAGVYEITQRQYERVTGLTPSFFADNPMHPVEMVSWNDITGSGTYASGFIATLRSKTGLTTLNLPEADPWEYACRAGTTYDFNDYTQNRGKGAGDGPTLARLGWYGGNSGSSTHDAGGKQPNAWGLYDMHGNILEWTLSTVSSYRIVCGGDWGSSAEGCRSGGRGNDAPDDQDDCLGFRLTLPPVSTPSSSTFDQGEFTTFGLTVDFIFRVDVDNTSASTKDGASWATAYSDIQSAVDAAFAAGYGEVWVAQGTYTGVGGNAGGTDNVVVMKENVHLYGGFIGLGTGGSETSRDQRNWTTHVTTIDGENTRRDVYGANNATLDGFTVAHGKTSGGGFLAAFGGGMSNVFCSPTVTNCTFSENNASDCGGGMSNYSSSPTVENCTFSGNLAFVGGGIYNISGSPAVRNSSFLRNSAGVGGGMSNESSSPTVTNCTFLGNSATYGGGISNQSGSPAVTNCMFSGNSASYIGGGMCNDMYSSPAVTNCTFSGNSASDRGGGIFNGGSSSPFVTNCILWNDGSEITVWSGSSATVTYSDVQGGYSGTGNIDVEPLFVDAARGDVRLRVASPCIDVGTSAGAPATDILGVTRPQDAGIDMGAYEFSGTVQDADGDGLPDVNEAIQGCSDIVADAALYATLDRPTAGATFQSTPIVLSGRISSSYVDAVVISTDNGVTWDKVATISGLTWSYSWSPTVSGRYDIKLKASNTFGGTTQTDPVTVYYRPNYPAAAIVSPVSGTHLRGAVTVTGTAAGAAGFGLQDWVLDVRPGTDPNATAGRIELNRSSSDVVNGTLYTGSTDGVADGPYTLKLIVTDASGDVSSTTYVTFYVDHDTTPPDAPSSVAIAGQLLANVVANGNSVDVTGAAEADTYISSAEVVDQSGNPLKDVTENLTLHRNGSLRGTFTLPAGMTAETVALRVRVKDAAGNVSDATISNALAVDNAAPTITVTFPKPEAILPRSQIIVNGIAEDNGAFDGAPAAGLQKVELSTNGTTWLPATGTDYWVWYDWFPTADGEYTLHVRVTDNLGNAAESTLTVTVNNQYPSAYITSLSQGPVINEGNIVLASGTATDTDFYYYRLQYARGVSPSSGYTDILGQIFIPRVDGRLGFWDTTGLDEGPYTLRLFVMDLAGNFVRFDMQVWIASRLSLADIPDAVLNEDAELANFVHLPDYCTALSGDPETFTYTITGNTNPSCGVSIDTNNNIDIDPAANWNGTSTVTVQVSNGVLTNDDTFTITVNPINDVPTAPVVGIAPADPLDADNLVGSVTTPSTDPDVQTNGQTINYTYAWYASTNLTQVIGTSTTLAASITQPGVSYTCVVTPNDGFVNGPLGQATVLVRSATTITASVQPGTITLGGSLTVSGTISATAGLGTVVSFTSTPPRGSADPTLPIAVSIPGSTYSQPNYWPHQAGSWQVVAQWPGDTQYRGASSTPASFTVEKAPSSLTVSLNASSAPLNYADLEATVNLSASLPESLRYILAGRTVQLNIQKPDLTFLSPIEKTTDADGVAVFSGTDFSAMTFDTPGTWKFRANFEGDADFLASASLAYDDPAAPRLTIKDRAGYAVIVVGQLDADGEGRREHAKTADFVYRSLRDRGFAAEDINYLRGTVTGYPALPDITVSATPPSQTGVEQAITEWALDKMTESPAPLYVIFVDHGGVNAFYVYSGSYDETRVITPDELNGYFTELEDGLAAAGKPVQDLVFIYGACYSGSFVGGLTRTDHPERAQRTVITSTAPDEVSHRGVETDGVRDGDPFVTEFFRNASAGESLKESFERASVKIDEYTQSNTSGGESVQVQTPQLDDNGDGVSATSDGLSFLPDQDGAHAHELVLGYGVNADGSTSLISATPTVTLGVGATMGTLEALCDKRPATGLTAWIEVKTPAYAGGTPVSADPNAQEAVVLTPPVAYNVASSDLANGWFRWTDFGTLFDTPGTYKVFYYVKDGNSVSAHIVTTVYRASSSGNHPPAAVQPLYPDDGAVMKSTLYLAWSESTDADGDPITYRVEISESNTLPADGLIVKEGLATQYAQFTQADGIQDLCTYYWRVYAVDKYGARSTASTVRHFSVNNDNTSVPGLIADVVKNAAGNAAIAGATVTLNPGGRTCASGANGEYLFASVAPGAYTVRAAAPGYSDSTQPVTVSAGARSSCTLRLTAVEKALQVTPPSREVAATASATTFSVANTGAGTMAWTASVTAGGPWLHITSGASGSNAGTISLMCDANTGAQRVGTVRVVAEGATGSPTDVTVTQLAPSGGPGCKSAAKLLDMNVAEEELPLGVDAAPDATIPASSSLALRLTANASIDPESVWAMVEGEEYFEEGGLWRPTDASDGTDGWVIFQPTDPMPSGVVTMTVGATTVTGEEVGPVSSSFNIDAEKEYEVADDDVLLEDLAILPLPEILAAPRSPVYRIGPSGVFDDALVVQIPVPTGQDPDDLDIYYLSESTRHPGWYRGENVDGWLVPNSRRLIEEDGQTYIEVQVNHSGVIQLGHAARINLGSVGSVEVGVTGSSGQWLSLLGTALMLLLAAGALWRRKTEG